MNRTRFIELRNEFQTQRDIASRLSDAAELAGRALTPAEEAQYDAACTRMEAIDVEIQRANNGGGEHAVAAINRAIGVGAGAADTPSMGEQLLARGKATLGAVGNVRFAADADTLGRALQHGVSADGTSVSTIEGDLVKFVDANRYAVNAARRVPMPQNHSKTFQRPRVTQHTQVGNQAAEGDVLASRRLQTTGDEISKLTRGGTLALSEQEIDWTDPAMLGLAIQDLAEQYAIDTDTVLVDAIEAAVTSNVTTCALDAGSGDFIEALASAAGAVYGTSKKLPNVVYVGINRWVYLLGLTDGEGRPLFPALGSASNSIGVSPGAGTFGGTEAIGLRVVVDPNFDPDFMAVAASQLVEFYEQDKGLLSVNAPSTLEVIYAYRGYVAANVYAEGLNGLGPDA
jgi:hypothetical protein